MISLGVEARVSCDIRCNRLREVRKEISKAGRLKYLRSNKERAEYS